MRIQKTPFLELMLELVIASLLVVGVSATSWADTLTTRDESVTVIHLDEYKGYFANDLFDGGRLALNDAQDTALPAGVVFDIDTSKTFFSIETERRLGDNAFLELRARAITGADSGETAYAFGQDGYIQWRIVRNF